MERDAEKPKYVRPPAWRLRLIILRKQLAHTFSGEDSYVDSSWASWEKRIQEGHFAEAKRIDWTRQDDTEWPHSDPFDDFEEWPTDDYTETCTLTTSMYAALIVSIWSEMEHFLKDTVSLCYLALKKRKKAFQETRQFCDDSLAGRQPTVALDKCIRALKAIKSGVPFKFQEIKNALKKEVDVTVEACVEYKTVDAVRILNNSFKHAGGYYRPKRGEPHTCIDEELLNGWAVLGTLNAINYADLPLQTLVVACNAFCVDLLNKTENALRSKLEGSSHDG